MKSPAVTEERKFELLDEELQNRKIGSDATGRMLKKLIEDNKFNLLDDVIDNFGKLMRAKRGELIAIVTSADKLAKKTSTALKAGLEAQFDNKTVIIDNKARNYFTPPTHSCPYYLSVHTYYVIQQVCIYTYVIQCMHISMCPTFMSSHHLDYNKTHAYIMSLLYLPFTKYMHMYMPKYNYFVERFCTGRPLNYRWVDDRHRRQVCRFICANCPVRRALSAKQFQRVDFLFYLYELIDER